MSDRASGSRTVTSSSQRETEAIARAIGSTLRAGDRVHLSGDLGAGKTAFVRGLAEGLGIDPADVSSPSFTLVQEYRGRTPLYHVDLYRITAAEVADLGLEALGADGVLAIEWAERLADPDPSAVRVLMEHAGETARRITITDAGD